MESFSAETNSTGLYLESRYLPQTVLAMAIFGLTFVLGLPGNGLVLWVAGLKMRRTVNTVWFLHLTLADFLCCLSLPFSMTHLALHGFWPYGRTLCKIIPSVIILNMFTSVFLLTAISLDRCLLVLKPIWCQNHRSVRTAWGICGCIWLVAFVMCIPVFVYRETSTLDNYTICIYDFGSSVSYYPDYTYDPDILANITRSGLPMRENSTNTLNNSDAFFSNDLELFPNATLNGLPIPELSEDFQDFYLNPLPYENQTHLMAITFTRLAVGFLLPMLIMMTCYTLIVFRLGRVRIARSQNKAFRLAVVVVTVFLLCWTPYHVFGVLMLFTNWNSSFGEALRSWDCVSLALASANSCFNPFLYALLGKDLRKRARQSVKGILEAAFNEEPTKSTSFAETKVYSEKCSLSTSV